MEATKAKKSGTRREFVVWGKHPAYAGGVPIKLAAGTIRYCRGELKQRDRQGGWVGLAILPVGAPYAS